MKKILSILLCLFLCFTLGAITGCSSEDTLIDLEDCKIGYELPVYPNVSFVFEIEDGTLVEISNYKVVLKEKNTHIGNDPLTHDFFRGRYVVSVSFHGKTDPKYVGYSVHFSRLIRPGYYASGKGALVGENGEFDFEATFFVERYISEFVFGEIEFYKY